MLFEHQFHPRSCRHTEDGRTVVLHCHHYTTLYSQLADDCGMLDGRTLLAECAEDTFLEVLGSHFRKHELTRLGDRLAVVERYYAEVGLGQLKVDCAGPEGGEVSLPASHVDAGWLKKWGTRERPVNFLTCGYVAAVFAALFERPARSYTVHETASIVSGAPVSRFQIVAR